MSHNWKLGDVAMVRNEHGVWNLAICALSATEGTGWRYGVADSWMSLDAKARPLVVIDPASREQVERVADLIPNCGDVDNHCDPQQCMSMSCWVDRVSTALREFATPTPPKPDEPRGKYAVVEEADGTEWCRIDSAPGGFPWQVLGQPFAKSKYETWPNIPAVRVLSEGVTA